MTSAPSHASIWVHDVPASNWVRSRMRMPFSAVLMVFLPYGIIPRAGAVELFVYPTAVDPGCWGVD
jgi:hypothetical protein